MRRVLTLTLVTCAVLGVVLIVRYDLYEREPWWMLLLAAVAGFLVMMPMGPLEDGTLSLFGSAPRPSWLIGIVASTHEEAARFMLVLVLAIFVRSQFNDPIDGLIYGSVIGLGMALEESLNLMRIEGIDGPLPPPNELVRFCGHLVMGGITGYAFGLARFGIRGWKFTMAWTVAFSLLMHAVWDWIAFEAMRAGVMARSQTIGAVALMLSGMVVYGGLVVRGSQHSRRVFAPHHPPRRLWGWPFRTNETVQSRDP